MNKDFDVILCAFFFWVTSTQLELSQEEEVVGGELGGIASVVTANRNGSYQSTTSPSIARSLSSPEELLDSPPPPDHRRSSVAGKQQQHHFICSSTTNRGASAPNNLAARSVHRIQV